MFHFSILLFTIVDQLKHGKSAKIAFFFFSIDLDSWALIFFATNAALHSFSPYIILFVYFTVYVSVYPAQPFFFRCTLEAKNVGKFVGVRVILIDDRGRKGNKKASAAVVEHPSFRVCHNIFAPSSLSIIIFINGHLPIYDESVT